MRHGRLFPLLFALGVTAPAMALDLDTISLHAGTSDKDGDLVRLAITSEWPHKWPNDQWIASGYWEVSIAGWHSDRDRYDTNDLIDIGFTPVARITGDGDRQWRPFVEVGIGVHLLSEDRIGDKELGGQFQFGSHVGTGVKWERLEFSIRVQHLSNAGLEEPNPGINFFTAGLGWRF